MKTLKPLASNFKDELGLGIYIFQEYGRAALPTPGKLEEIHVQVIVPERYIRMNPLVIERCDEPEYASPSDISILAISNRLTNMLNTNISGRVSLSSDSSTLIEHIFQGSAQTITTKIKLTSLHSKLNGIRLPFALIHYSQFPDLFYYPYRKGKYFSIKYKHQRFLQMLENRLTNILMYNTLLKKTNQRA